MEGVQRDTREGYTLLLGGTFCGRVDKALEERVALEASSLCLFLHWAGVRVSCSACGSEWRKTRGRGLTARCFFQASSLAFMVAWWVAHMPYMP